MTDPTAVPPAATPGAGHEERDIDFLWVLAAVAAVVVAFVALLAVLWGLYRTELPKAGAGAGGLPVVTPGERPVNERLGGVRPPRLEGLRELQAVPPTVHPSADAAGRNAPEFHPEDLRADRQPRLSGYAWVDRGKGVARIPIDRAMDVVAARKQGGAK